MPFFLPASGNERSRESEQADRDKGVLTPSLGHRHHFEQMTVRIFEIEATPTTATINFAVTVAEGAAAIRDSLGLDPIENRVELRLADMESIVVTLS